MRTVLTLLSFHSSLCWLFSVDFAIQPLRARRRKTRTVSLHEQPVPRTGGIAVLAARRSRSPSARLACGCRSCSRLLLAAVSFIDDLHRLPAAGSPPISPRRLAVWYVLARCTRSRWRS